MGAAGRCLLCSLSQGFPSGAAGVLPVLFESPASVGIGASIYGGALLSGPTIDNEPY
jgi:hypothetical protein